jgi:hypothetical protein
MSGLLFALAACSGGPPPEERDTVTPVCDGQLQEDEGGVVDGPFDKDADGYVDANDADCRANYGVNRLDCDDADGRVHPDQGEVVCNAIDDDCNSETEDAQDADFDGALACDDCDDQDPRRFPGNSEDCWDELDNDCDGSVDPGCPPNFNGTFDLDQPVQLECRVLGIPYVNVAFTQVNVLWNPPYANMSAVGSPQPGAVEGTIDPDTGEFAFHGEAAIATALGCSEYYDFVGQFDGTDAFTMTFTAEYVGWACGRCESVTEWTLSGVRVSDGTTQ